MNPVEIVEELNKNIVGQDQAKRAVAVAMRNRWRRMQLEEPMRSEIRHTNIMLIGPTGVGKTEIARRLAKLADAPFIKVEATKFTEVGYVGRDVDAVIRDLLDVSFKELKKRALQACAEQAASRALERVLDVLLPTATAAEEDEPTPSSPARKKLRRQIEEGKWADRMVEIEVSSTPTQMQVMGPPGMEDMTEGLQNMFESMMKGHKKPRKVSIAEALRHFTEEESQQLLDEEELRSQAISKVENSGIVFLDEIDKIASRESHGADVSRQGVQRDLLPLVEGTVVSTRYGMVKTDHILFIASGAFHLSRPSDLIPELQGRFPIRVELQPLSVEDFVHILTQTDYCLVKQYQELFATEKIQLSFAKDGVRRLAEMAYQINENTENVGARRLYTVMEKLLADISYENKPGKYTINAKFVNQVLADLVADKEQSRYIL